MTSYSQLEKKLYRACIGSGFSDDEMVRALTAALVGIMVSNSVKDWRQRSKQLAKFAIYDIIDGVIDTEAQKAFGAELCSLLARAHGNDDDQGGPA
jgi:hypothetical protein